jgi:peptidoglycan/LPS O-acetylase OafA/YrhL
MEAEFSRRPPAIATSRRAQIDALRAIAIFWVLFDHYWLEAGSGPMGRLGVEMFLLISGYLITHILLGSRAVIQRQEASRGRALRTFYTRRALRIMPAYYMAILLTWLLHAPEFGGSLPWHALFGTSILIAINNDWGPPWQLGHLWTLSVQEQFYLLWPLLILFARGRSLVACLFILAMIGPLYRLAMVSLGYGDMTAAITLLPGSITPLALGAGLAILELEHLIPGWLAHPGTLWPTCAALLFIAANLMGYPHWIYYLFFDYVWLFPLAALLLAASIGIGGTAGKVLDWKWLQFLGRISLGLYLYQYIAMDAARYLLYRAHLDPSKGPPLFFTAAALSAFLALLSWMLFERRINALKRFFPYREAARGKATERALAHMNH